MPSLVPGLALALAALAAWAPPAAPADPCGVVGTYALDRAPIVADVVASMDASLAELGDRPAPGTIAHVEWTAKQEAFARTRAEAAGGGLVPHVALDLAEGGAAAYRVSDPDGTGRAPHTGRWAVDAGCRTLTLDTGDDTPATARIDGDRLVFPPDRRGQQAFSGATFDRVR